MDFFHDHVHDCKLSLRNHVYSYSSFKDCIDLLGVKLHPPLPESLRDLSPNPPEPCWWSKCFSPGSWSSRFSCSSISFNKVTQPGAKNTTLLARQEEALQMEPSYTVIIILVRNAELNLCQTFSFADFATKAGQKMSLEEAVQRVFNFIVRDFL